MVSGPFTGPPMKIVPDRTGHLVIVEAPTPGWTITLDRTEPGHRHQRIYLTLREPDPASIWTQVIVEQKVATFVPLHNSVKAYARRVANTDRKLVGIPYAVAAEAEASAPPPSRQAPPQVITGSTPAPQSTPPNSR